jgi:integrase/recombinase XerC
MPTPKAAKRVRDFFTAQLHNDHTRKAYLNATRRFAEWCEVHGIRELAEVEPYHIAAFIKDLQDKERQEKPLSAPTVKQHLAALRMLFDWLVIGQVLEVNPAASVRGPTHVVRKGQTPLLEPKEARKLLDSIDISTPIGLRDRALLALMVYSFARVGAALAMRVEDVYTERRRLWVRLREKGGKAHVMPCHHNLENYLTAYIDKTGIADDPKGPLFRTVGRRTKRLTRTPLSQPDAYRMIERRTEAAGIETKIGNHSFRATGITAYLKNGGTLEKAASMANHASTRTTQLYDRRSDEVTLDEVERVGI